MACIGRGIDGISYSLVRFDHDTSVEFCGSGAVRLIE